MNEWVVVAILNIAQVKDNSVVLQMPDKSIKELPCGMVVWAAVSLPICLQFLLLTHSKYVILLQGNKGRQVTQDLMAKLPDFQKNRRGISVDGMLYCPIAAHV